MELLSSLLLVTAVGLALGAGLPALFSLGIRFATPPASRPRRALAWFFFALTALAVVAGVLLVARERIAYFFF